jgi:hypothetical protein
MVLGILFHPGIYMFHVLFDVWQLLESTDLATPLVVKTIVCFAYICVLKCKVVLVNSIFFFAISLVNYQIANASTQNFWLFSSVP